MPQQRGDRVGVRVSQLEVWEVAKFILHAAFLPCPGKRQAISPVFRITADASCGGQ